MSFVYGLAFAGCATPNKQYQPVGSIYLNDDKTPYKRLCAIEFDEQGDLWSPAQSKSAREMISRSGRKPLLIVFVHGWHNNASPDNPNLQSFNRLLKQLSERMNTDDTEVVGVFIGWRGLAIERTWDKTGLGWLARHLSFYSRKDDTDLVAGIPLTRTLYGLASASHSRHGRVIFIGHSFGARILERALAQAIVGQTSGLSKADSVLPADLTLLINPASEAITARRLKLALEDWQLPAPAIISATSVGDTDTSTWWSLAMGAATYPRRQSQVCGQSVGAVRSEVVEIPTRSSTGRGRRHC